MKHYVFFIFFALVCCLPTAGWTEDVYTVRDIHVDVTASDSVAARNAAINRAQSTAFDRLVERLVPRWEQARLDNMDADQISPMIRDFSVNNERRSATRYVADITVRFNENIVQTFFDRQQIFYSDQPRPPVLLAPIWRDGNELILWQDNNPWRVVWNKSQQADKNALVPILTPLGDLQDMTKINTARALLSGEASTAAINNFIDRYQASDLLVVVAQKTTSGHRASLYEFNNGRFQVAGRVTGNAGLDDLAMNVRRFLTSEWKYQTLRNAGSARGRQLSVYISHDQLNWAKINQRLSDVQMIDRITPHHFATDGQVVKLTVSGTPDQLASALRPIGYDLDPVELADRVPMYAENAQYRIHRRGR